MSDSTGFVNSLFDLSFKELITTKIIRILYVIAIGIAAVIALGFIVKAFGSSFLLGLLVLVLSPIIFLIYVIFFRVWMEIILVLFRIAENTDKMVHQNQGQ